MAMILDGTSGLTTPGVVNTAGETIATTLSVTGTSYLGGVVLTPAGGEGGNIDFQNIGGASNGLTIDVSTADVARIFTIRNNSTLSIGQLAGTGGTVIISTAATERMRIDSSGNLLFNSGYGSVATAYGCRAWVNFNGTGTVAIRASGNVSSITDSGVGVYTVNFTTAMPDANYCINVSASNDGTDLNTANKITGTPSTSSFQVQHIEANVAADGSRMFVTVFR